MQSQVIHQSTEEFVSVSTYSSEQISLPHKGHVIEHSDPDMPPDDLDLDMAEPPHAKHVNGKGKKEKRKSKAGPKSRKLKASKKKFLDELAEDDEQSLDLQLDDETSEMNESVDQITDADYEPTHNGTNGVSFESSKESPPICFGFFSDANTNKEMRLDCEESIGADEPVKEIPVTIGDEETEKEVLEEDLDIDDDCCLADLVAAQKNIQKVDSPVVESEVKESLLPVAAEASPQKDKGQGQASEPITEELPSTSRDPVLSDEILKAPFVRYLSTVTKRRPLHSTQEDPGSSEFDSPCRLVPGESSRNIFKFFGLATKQSYTVNDTSSSPSLGKRKADDSPVVDEEKSSKKLKTEDENKSPGFFSMIGRFRRNLWRPISLNEEVKDDEVDLAMDAAEVSDSVTDAEEVVGMEELPVSPTADETNKWCSVM